ncbi:hypothetical protein BDZ94DRAFT_1161583, partial [Collybia nuda]
IPFKKCVDPQNTLQYAAMGSAFVHTTENEVEYFVLNIGNGGSKQFKPMDPALFHIGDIVEAQISFFIVPFKSNYHFKMIHILQAITLLDAKFQKVSQRINILCSPKPTTLKRKVSYLDDELEENQTKILKMTIDNDI